MYSTQLKYAHRNNGAYTYMSNLESASSLSGVKQLNSPNERANPTAKKLKKKRKSRSKKRIANYKSVKRYDWAQQSWTLDKANNTRNTSDRRYHYIDGKEENIYPSYINTIDPRMSDKLERGRLKGAVTKTEEFINTNRSRSEGSHKKSMTNKNFHIKDAIINTNKTSILDNYELRRKDRWQVAQEEGQLIYTFRDQNDSVENADEDIEKEGSSPPIDFHLYNSKIDENTIKMKNSDILFNTMGKTGETLSQTLLSIKSQNKEFSNTGKYKENINTSDYNIMNNNENAEMAYYSSIEKNSHSSKYRSISKKRVSKTDRRDVAKVVSSKANIKKEIREDSVESTEFQGFQALLELQKKYNRLKRHCRKEK